MFWRRFAIKDIPISDPKLFEDWLSDQWKIKDKLLADYKQNGKFPASQQALAKNSPSDKGYINTEVKMKIWYEVGQIFVVLVTAALLFNILVKVLTLLGVTT